eukprot:CAMPEP_0177795104 /NCGR_PEP_ID=MMETSP0491_2-20121128/26032_1 /TAXON_ID=63592 /ORGANISM="Tetraselmis chuii, Strain PLY429" /LENGTH=866 /DNA_ID=CAMNT_0019317867 /DNA_START=27 /DNA_END=2627 /DNA_ORIENTATION=-
MSFAKLWKKWMGQTDPNHRIAYQPHPHTGTEGTNLEEVGGTAAPPSRPYEAGPSDEVPSHFYEEHMQANQQETEQEELMLALALSESLNVGNEAQMSQVSSSRDRADVLSHKYWKEGILGIDDRLCDGFFDINGEFPELGHGDIFPSYEFVSRFEPAMDDLREVVIIESEKDTALGSVENLAMQAFCALLPSGMMAAISAVAQVVARQMGGAVRDDNEIYAKWQAVSARLKMSRSPSGVGGLIVPLGGINPGLSRHRALLFKYLAGIVCIPCDLLRARTNNFSDDLVAMIIINIDKQEFLVDLMEHPGAIITPEEWYGRSITSPNGMAARTPEPLASLPSLCPSPDDGPPVHASSGGRQQGGAVLVERPTALRERPRDEDALSNASSEQDGPAEWSDAQIVNSIYRPTNGGGHSRPQPSRLNGDSPPLGHSRSGPEMDYHRRNESRDLIDLRSPAASMPFGQFQERAPPHAQGAENPGFQPTVRPLSPLPNRSPSHGRPRGQQVASPTSPQPPPPNQHPTTMDAPLIVEHAESGHLDLPLDNFKHGEGDTSSSTDDEEDGQFEESTPGFRVWDPITDCLIDMSEVTMLSRLGVGSYGEVHRAEWQGTEVAVKQFLEQQMTDAVQEEFLQEVRIMKDLRHPNIVQFMGATWKPRGIVMQYMHRGSLFRLLHRNNKGKRLHMHRRLRMALDVALGMRYLHSRKPLIVHRDLKSPNLLVAKDWTVRLCDFGLSKLKSNTFLSTKSTGGTPEWMAPEVLRNEPANEKSDVYSFAVIMWELMFYKEPWHGTRPMQVVFAVGSINKRLPLPFDTPLNSLIEDCWLGDPEARPSFEHIYERLKQLQRPINNNFEEDAPAGGAADGQGASTSEG